MRQGSEPGRRCGTAAQSSADKRYREVVKLGGGRRCEDAPHRTAERWVGRNESPVPARRRQVRSLSRALLATCALLLAGCGAGGAGPTQATAPATTAPSPSPPSSPSPAPDLSPTASRPCGLGGQAPARLQHVVFIVMENRAYSEVIGSPDAPYINHLAAICGLATNYKAVAHPSLPNYLALTSGSTQGVTDDGGPDQHPLSAPSIFSLLGTDWRSLEESMPTNCDLQSGGEYAVKHNPAAYFTSVRQACRGQDVPLTSPPDLSAAFTFITPNLCDDMHDCATTAGDSWLAREVPRLLSTPQYLAGQTVIFITWDESTGSTQQVPLLVIAPTVPSGARVAASFNHYSLLHTTEQLLGLSPLLGAASSAPSMVTAFNL